MSTVLLGALVACGAPEEGAPTPEPVGQAQQALEPSDPLFNSQRWHYELIRAPQAWNLTMGFRTTSIAVLDSGKMMHPDLVNKWQEGYDFVEGRFNATDVGTYHHGTHVAGTLAASANNGTGGVGVCPSCLLVPVRIAQAGGSISAGAPGANDPLTTVMARGIYYAAGYAVNDGAGNVVQASSRASVINISLGNIPAPCPADLQAAVNAAVAAGVPVVVAAGNRDSAMPTSNFANYLWGSCQNVISVAAVNEKSDYESYSAQGPGITIGAPGGDEYRTSPYAKTGEAGFGALIGCTDPEETRGIGTHGVVSSWTTSQGVHCYRHWAGTSMAAPHVSGTIGLMRTRNRSLTPAQIKTILTSTGRWVIPCTGPVCPPKTLDAHAAVSASLFDDITLTCRSIQSGGAFNCEVRKTGGLAPFTGAWTAVAPSAILPMDRTRTDTVRGICTPGTDATASVTLTDALGRAQTRTSTFRCFPIQ
ncbi:S8 family serine peptidase [Myxococcus stipitatus]|uniref:S8 family serine peptidase n=1 Tax=Myxococcus stipitatus TaxID=83455 RepID=UPI003145410A